MYKREKRNKRLKMMMLCCCLLIPLCIGLSSSAADTGTQKNLMMGTTGVNYIENPKPLSGDLPWDGDYLHFGLTQSNKWRILERSGDKLLLFSNDILPVPQQPFDSSKNVYETSAIRTYLNNEGLNITFSDGRERALVLPTTISAKANTEFNNDGSHVISDWTDGGVIGAATTVSYTNPALSGDKLFLLSVDEITNPNYGFYRNGSGKNVSRKTVTDERFWLRSGYVDDPMYPAIVDCFPNGGLIRNNYECDGKYWVMAAANIDISNILFVSSSTGGKISGSYGADALNTVSDTNTNDFKLTLTDQNLKLALSHVKRTSNTFSFDYTATGSANNISAIILDNANNIVSYGRIKDISASHDKKGNASINVPTDFDSAGYTLKVFPEEYHGDNATDFAGQTVLVEESTPIDEYTVTFKNDDGTVLKTEVVEKGKDATAPNTPTKEGYTFKGWDKSFTNITGDLDVVAQFTINTYTVIFQNYDNTVLKTEIVNYESSATAPTVPERPGYIFTGWDKNFSNVKNNITTIAQFSERSTDTCLITFKDYNGTILKTEDILAGGSATAPHNPIRNGYTFIGWDKAFTNVTTDLEVTAQYQINKYTVTFKDYDGTVLKSDKVDYNQAAIAPNNPSRKGYTFTSWDKSFTNVINDLEIIAQYKSLEKQYTVVFKDDKGEIIKTETVISGHSATPPTPPKKDGYTFIGWSQNVSDITSDMEIIAQYHKTEVTSNIEDVSTKPHSKEPKKSEKALLKTTVKSKKDVVNTSDSTDMIYPYILMMGYSIMGLIVINRSYRK